jgi:hypothetical protein
VTPRLVDLDDPSALERVWNELERVHAIRHADPELRTVIEHRLNELDPAVAAPIRVALDEMHPEAIVAAHFKTLVHNRATVGAIRRGTAGR